MLRTGSLGRRPDASLLRASLFGACLLVLSLDGVQAAILLTDTTNITLAASQAETGGDTTDNPDVTGGAGGVLVPYTGFGSFTCCGPAYLGDNLDDVDIGTGNPSDGTYAIPDAGTLILDFGFPQVIASIAIKRLSTVPRNKRPLA